MLFVPRQRASACAVTVKRCVLAGMVLLLQTVQGACAESFADVYAWVYRTGKEVPLNVPAATCLGLKTPQNVYERTWLAPDFRFHAIEVGEDGQNPFVLLTVRRSLTEVYYGSYWLAGKDGRLLGTCSSPFMNASFVPIEDGSLDAKFESEKTYILARFGQRARWDTFVPNKRNYP